MSSHNSNKLPLQLKGSIDIIVEFFNYGINSILYQRGLYPEDNFIQREKYGLPLLVTTHPELRRYLDIILNQMKEFLERKKVHKIVVVIVKLNTMETVERWQFDVELECQNDITNNTSIEACADPEKKRQILREIQDGIRRVIRQITASVTFLPTLEGSHSFDILLYTDKDLELPNSEWKDTNARLINNGQNVQLRGFSTNVHRIEPIVSYVNKEDN